MRNLKRLTAAGIRAPEAIEVRDNVLVMDFVGDSDGWASPRLKDAEVTRDQCEALYAELLINVRTMFHQCRLVHADLSEYNVLFHEGHLWIIDVSQSVEHDHPAAFDFLRNDLRNVEDFFGRRGAKCLGLRSAFDFVTRELDPKEDVAELLTRWRAETDGADINEEEGSHEKKTHEEEVFRQSYIPRSLNDLYDPERDVAAVKRGEGSKLIYADTIGLVEEDKKETTSSSKAVHFDGTVEDGSEEDGDEDEEGGSGEEDISENDTDFKERQLRGHRHEDKDVKKVCLCLFSVLRK